MSPGRLLVFLVLTALLYYVHPILSSLHLALLSLLGASVVDRVVKFCDVYWYFTPECSGFVALAFALSLSFPRKELMVVMVLAALILTQIRLWIALSSFCLGLDGRLVHWILWFLTPLALYAVHLQLGKYFK